jgi:hypothetical protein
MIKNVLIAFGGIGAIVFCIFMALNFTIKGIFESPDFHNISVNPEVKGCVYAAAFNEGDCETRKDISCEGLVSFYEGICSKGGYKAPSAK